MEQLASPQRLLPCDGRSDAEEISEEEEGATGFGQNVRREMLDMAVEENKQLDSLNILEEIEAEEELKLPSEDEPVKEIYVRTCKATHSSIHTKQNNVPIGDNTGAQDVCDSGKGDGSLGPGRIGPIQNKRKEP